MICAVTRSAPPKTKRLVYHSLGKRQRDERRLYSICAGTLPSWSVVRAAQFINASTNATQRTVIAGGEIPRQHEKTRVAIDELERVAEACVVDGSHALLVKIVALPMTTMIMMNGW